jgi:hypothetical protein
MSWLIINFYIILLDYLVVMTLIFQNYSMDSLAIIMEVLHDRLVYLLIFEIM